MRIGVDGRSLADDGVGSLRQPRGIARYTCSLLGALAAAHPEDEWVALMPRGAAPPSGVSARRSRLAGRAGHAAAALGGRPRLDRLLGGGAEVVWLPAPAPVAVSPRTPYVLTLHDLSFETLPRAFGRYERLWQRATRPRRLALGATRVMAVSEATRREAIHRWGLPPERVVTVRSGVWRPPAGDAEALRRRLPLPERYVLFVGALEPRKGLDVLLDAHAEARRRGLESGLVLAGDGPLRGALNAPGVVLAGRVSDSELGALYAAARTTVLPSLCEGFGFTPLESLAAGTPAVVSDLSALRETVGDAALRVPPGDRRALADALLAIERDDALRERLLDAARGPLGRLSWERAAQQAHEVLAAAAARA
jgi:glycosyltransferase involved in cell wall biosynthesis